VRRLRKTSFNKAAALKFNLKNQGRRRRSRPHKRMILLKRDFEISTKSDVKIHTTVLATNDFGFFKA